MTEEYLFRLYFIVVVGILAQSLLAWEWGSKGMEYFWTHGLNKRVIFAFSLFLIQVIWMRVSNLETPLKSWKDCWPVLFAIVAFVVGRARRTANQGKGV